VGEVQVTNPRYHLEVWGARPPRLTLSGFSTVLGTRRLLTGLATNGGLKLSGMGRIPPGYDAQLTIDSGAWNYPVPHVEARLSESSRKRLGAVFETQSGIQVKIMEARARLSLKEFQAGKIPEVRLRMRKQGERKSRVLRTSLSSNAILQAASQWRAGGDPPQEIPKAKPTRSLRAQPERKAQIAILKSFRELTGGLEPREYLHFMQGLCGRHRTAGRHPLGHPEIPGWSLAPGPGEDGPGSFCGDQAARRIQALEALERPASGRQASP
jgi:hypothetical protein